MCACKGVGQWRGYMGGNKIDLSW